MKINLTLIFIITLFTAKCFGQVDVTIQGLQYTNNGEPTENASSCGTIDLKSSTSTSIDFGINLSKPNGQTVGTSTISIYTKKSSSDTRIQQGSSITIQESSWNHPTSGNDTFSSSSGSFSVNAGDFNVSGGTLYVVFKTSGNIEYESCKYSIEKDPTPTFELANDSYSIPCGSTSNYTFTVNNVYNSPGTLSYSWNVGSGWKRDGIPVSGTITTTTNSITLVPNSTTVLPSNVSVTTTLDGQTYGTETATVSRSTYNPIYEITGNDQLCTTATYSVNNLPAGTSVTSWSVSNNSIASISGIGNQATLTANSNGTVYVTAILTNACGQTKGIIKSNIKVGKPTVNNYGISGGSSSVFTNSVSYFSVSPASGATSYYWWITPAGGCSAGSGPTINNVNPYTTTGTTVMVNWGACPGTYSVVCRAQNSCEGTTTVGQKFVTVNDPNTDPCNSFSLRISPNPSNANKKSDVTINLLPDPDPCPTLVSSRTSGQDYHVEIYDFYGEQKYVGNFKSENIKLNGLKLKKGIYILNVTNTFGIVKSEKLVID